MVEILRSDPLSIRPLGQHFSTVRTGKGRTKALLLNVESPFADCRNTYQRFFCTSLPVERGL